MTHAAATYPKGDWLAILDGDWKLMWNSQGRSELFNLAQDPHEKRNLIHTQRERADALARNLQTYLAALPRSQSNEPVRAVDDATRDALKNLGYIH